MLGKDEFVNALPTQNTPYGTTIRSYLQRFLQNTGGQEVFMHQGMHTSKNVRLIAGDFWLNVYADSLNVGADLLSGTGLSRYVALREIIIDAERKVGKDFDYVLIDLPPSFGSLVRAAFYSSDYYVVPCTSDSFSAYCLKLLGQMVPAFLNDWRIGLSRFKTTNPHFTNFDERGKPVFSGWIFNGFDTAKRRRTKEEIIAGVVVNDKEMIRADQTMHDDIAKAVQVDLVAPLQADIADFNPIASSNVDRFRIGDIEDANVLIQNSLWLNVPLGELGGYEQVTSLYDRRAWAENQIAQINLIRAKFDELAANVIAICV